MTRAHATPSPGERGFTLIELIIVIAILAFAAVVTPLAAPMRHSMTVDVAARDVALGLRAARSAAIYGNKETTFTLDGTAGRYWSDAMPAGKRLPARISPERATVDQIRFFPDGGASGGTIVLSDTRRSAAIQVDALSGRASINVGR